MSVFIIQAVQRSGDGLNSVRVISRWPYEAANLEGAKAFADATPSFSGWEKVDSFEIVSSEGKLLAKRPFAAASNQAWIDNV